jgi:2-amino-4-hydroxy-6-hydroxymethyldihydropteridine diphosphokinase
VGQALCRLTKIPGTRLMAHSRLWHSRPLGPQDQPDFVNAAAGLLTQLSPALLLEELKGIERLMGRALPPVRWGPRIIDLDLVVYDALVSDDASLTLPHPGAHLRNFVLYPLAEFAPELLIPGRGRVAELKARVGAEGLQLMTDGGGA